ncbi:unnamed protein product [Adineta steineri]|uniref:Uncharacterized protein n=1 Tax=Adineta steineri TaxID=433720 RepID=A0A816EL07_9BILA|nr:unnamed protein product [Adineta steineri]CAF1650674.1 unnamed protein product [Adineta steineri]
MYKEVYETLLDNNNDLNHVNQINQVNVHQQIPVSNHHVIPHSSNNCLKQIGSPLRRPHSGTDDDQPDSDLDDFIHDPTTKTISTTHKTNKKQKKTMMKNMNNINNIKNNITTPINSCDGNKTSGPYEVERLIPPQQTNNHQHNPNATTTSSQHIITSPPAINLLSVEAKTFAQTRFPFPPFIIRFSTFKIQEQKVSEELCKYLKENKKIDLELSGYRKSSSKCSPNECDILLFVKNSLSFSILYDNTNWPNTLLGLTYVRPSSPSIPLQLSLIIKNVGLSINFDDFSNDIKKTYSNVCNVIRMKNKNQMVIKLVKIEFSKPDQRVELLKRGKIFIKSLTYESSKRVATENGQQK